MFISNIFHAYIRWRRYRVSVRELAKLGDRELRDIGISRSDIQRVAWDSAQS